MHGVANPAVALPVTNGWLVPDWPVHGTVKALFSLRHSLAADGAPAGISQPPFDCFNLGSHVSDAPARVAANRQQLAQRMEEGGQPVFLNQVHGTGVQRLGRDTPHGVEADAAITMQPGVACTVLVADCLPVLLASSDGRVVGAVHAGWRGLAGGVLEAAIADFQACFRAPGHEKPARAAIKIIAWLGPCIGPERFEVGAEVRSAFMATQPDAASCFAPAPKSAVENGKCYADLAGLARLRLQALGITALYGNNSTSGWCTASDSALYFSHRRDAAPIEHGGNGAFTTGRMAACVWRSGTAAGRVAGSGD